MVVKSVAAQAWNRRTPFREEGLLNAVGKIQLQVDPDPNRVRDDYVPTGFKPYGAKTFAVKGHPSRLDLSLEDRRALIAFLKTL